jgi:OmcA/MtrC family decaheme c-type cytochrome
VACQQPAVGAHVADGAAQSTGPSIVLEDAWLDLHGHVVATFAVMQDDLPLALDDVNALAPRFTLATLTDHPVDGFRAWKSLLLTGSQVAAKLPRADPVRPIRILTSARQPGSETPVIHRPRQRPVSLRLREPARRIRSGRDGPRGGLARERATPSLGTSSTFDFRPSGGLLEARDTVLDENCGRCHGTVVHHGTRSRVRLCLTCHTWQHSDPDTIDPASMSTTATTDPNPLELGRLVHRIHRGKRLPTLYQSSSSAVPAPSLNAGNDLPLPFSPQNSTTALVGRKFSVVGDQLAEVVFGRVLQRTDNVQPPKTVVQGVTFPRDLRDCAVCHEGALQAFMVSSAISRRICSGCHPDVWFFDNTAPITDQAHLAHPGGPQVDDSQCRGCHVDAAGTSAPKLYAPIVEAHVRPALAPRYNEPTIEIVKVENLSRDKQPMVTFRLRDRWGAMAPQPGAPNPAWEPDAPTSSFVPRKLTSLTIRITGPTTPDYAYLSNVQIQSGTATNTSNPNPLTLSTTTDEYVYTFSSTIPSGATGTWVLGMEARRYVKVSHYDKTNDVFLWPYTGETVNETAENPIVYVNTATGTWTREAGSPGAVPRRTVVDQQKCLRCHGRIEFHGGGARHEVAWCVTCHTPDKADWNYRPKLYAGGPVNLGATFDGIEERSTHFKMLIHRIHTGGRTGAASLEAIAPVVVQVGSNSYFFDEGRFPNDLRNCTVCHAGKSYLVEAVPADAPPTLANEQPVIRHTAGTVAHVAGEPSVPPIQAACTGCHATGATFAHVAAKTVGGVETCANCHAKGNVSVEVVHGLAPASGGVSATFSSIVQAVLVPRCATAACHSGPPPAPPPQLDADAAYDALVGPSGVGVPSQQSSLKLVDPGAPERSYLVYKLRGDAGAVGGSTPTPMPIGDSLLDEATIRAIEAWIANGAPND